MRNREVEQEYGKYMERPSMKVVEKKETFCIYKILIKSMSLYKCWKRNGEAIKELSI